jgi:ribonucleoside-diphosphate reductase alpha chain
VCATSAGAKSSYAYEQLIDFFEESIIAPKKSFTIGLDYRIPVMHGLISKEMIQNLKLSPSYDELTFAAEYGGVWRGGSEDSWFNYEKLSKYRTLKNPEKTQKFKDASNVFYYISVDIARKVGGDQSVAVIFRVNIKNDRYYATVVNIKVLGTTDETKTFTMQTIDIKKLIKTYNPKEVSIDINGLGRGIADEMIKQQIGPDGQIYPAYGFLNNEDYKKIQPKDAPQIIYGMIAGGKLNSEIHGNVYTRLNSGLCRFLITEQSARVALLSTKVGKKMSYEDRIKRLMPHELTTRLFEEIANLKVKKAGLDIVLERINEHFPKDKYSALAYGLWRIKELEEENFSKKARRRKYGGKDLIFFTGGI